MTPQAEHGLSMFGPTMKLSRAITALNEAAPTRSVGLNALL